MNSYNFQISAKFLAPPTEIRHSDQSDPFQGATWKLRRVVQVPYPEPTYSFPDHTVIERLLRVVKVPYPQPEQRLPDPATPDPLEPTRESGPGWEPVVPLGNPHHRTNHSHWGDPLARSTVRITASRIQRDPSTQKRAIAKPFCSPQAENHTHLGMLTRPHSI